MRKWEVSSTLTVYHDGQFWVGVVEHVEDGMLSVARMVFGAEPSNEEVYTWVLERWSSLRLSAEAEPVGPRAGRLPGNPKRRAREAAKAMHQRGPSTASQLTLARERERARRRSLDPSAQRAEGKRRVFDGKNVTRRGVTGAAGSKRSLSLSAGRGWSAWMSGRWGHRQDSRVSSHNSLC